MMSKKQTAWHSSSEMWDDGVIEPSETRNYLGFCLAVIYNQKLKEPDFLVFLECR